MKSACFNGCSYTFGDGFAPDQKDQFIYDRLVSTRCDFSRTNFARSGSSNHEIFLTSAKAIAQEFDIIFVQWSGLNRIWLYPGPDCVWMTVAENEFRYRDLYLSKRRNAKFRDQLLLMNHDYKNIFTLVDYCQILASLADHHKKILVFINGLVPWRDDLVKPLGTDLASSLSNYSKKILDFDHRDDDEITKFFTQLQQKVASLDTTKWVNIWWSFRALTVDLGPEGHHPGIKSHAIMADLVVDYLVSQKII